MKVFIHKSKYGHYTILSGKPWPNGRFETTRETFWGAKRAAKRLSKKPAMNGDYPLLATFEDGTERL